MVNGVFTHAEIFTVCARGVLSMCGGWFRGRGEVPGRLRWMGRLSGGAVTEKVGQDGSLKGRQTTLESLPGVYTVFKKQCNSVRLLVELQNGIVALCLSCYEKWFEQQ